MTTPSPFDKEPITDLDRISHARISQRLINGLLFVGTFTLNKYEELKDKPEGYKKTSWVDEEDQRFGHSLALSRVNEISPDLGHFTLAMAYSKVDREEPSLLEGPRIFICRSDRSVNAQAKDARKEFDKYDMKFSILMLYKILEQLRYGDYHSDIDPKTRLALQDDDHIGAQLAKDFPAPRRFAK
jgi:hypothetical protein